ncbi:MAG: dimethylamine corrinoid protein 3 [Gammaproteobacteria bacterium]|nr:dimethylamine corrinoid protein 3 [Gammaproteobacteria bacterium]
MTQKDLNERAKKAVMAYDQKSSAEVAKEAIAAKADLVNLIQEGYTAGIQEVGDLYQAKKLFLPHIMSAANAMNVGVNLLTPELEKSGKSAGEGLGKFVICTIEGDIHSIGKDIVAIMLKVAGFNVVNMGRDIPVKDIVAAVKSEKPKAVGTSALMTSTMVNQKTFEELLKEEGVRDKVITNIGGAPTTQQWCDEIGADVYSENATDCVNKMVAKVKG